MTDTELAEWIVSPAGPECRYAEDELHLKEIAHRLTSASVLQAVLDAIAGTLDPSTEIADHPNVKFAQMRRLELTERIAYLEGLAQGLGWNFQDA